VPCVAANLSLKFALNVVWFICRITAEGWGVRLYPCVKESPIWAFWTGIRHLWMNLKCICLGDSWRELKRRNAHF
jgi:hypothetical protein